MPDGPGPFNHRNFSMAAISVAERGSCALVSSSPGLFISRRSLAWAVKNLPLWRFAIAQFLCHETPKVPVGFMPAGPQLAATNGNGTSAALRPVHPGGSNVFAHGSLHK